MPPRSRPGTLRQRRAETPREESLGGSLYQAFTQTALAPQPFFEPTHPTIIALVIVSQQMEETMECKDLELGQVGMARFGGLPPRRASRDDDIAEKTLHHRGHGGRPLCPPWWRVRGKAQH